MRGLRAPATRIELVEPGQLPAQWEHWPRTVQDSFGRRRGPGQWYLIRDGVATGNGYGEPVQAGEAGADRLGVPAAAAL